MRIVPDSKKTVPLVTGVSSGEVFYYNAQYYMRTNRSKGVFISCVQLRTGVINTFDPMQDVSLVKEAHLRVGEDIR